MFILNSDCVGKSYLKIMSSLWNWTLRSEVLSFSVELQATVTLLESCSEKVTCSRAWHETQLVQAQGNVHTSKPDKVAVTYLLSLRRGSGPQFAFSLFSNQPPTFSTREIPRSKSEPDLDYSSLLPCGAYVLDCRSPTLRAGGSRLQR